jgi:hypothetical protein
MGYPVLRVIVGMGRMSVAAMRSSDLRCNWDDDDDDL